MHIIQSTSHEELREGFWRLFVERFVSLQSKNEIYIGLSGGSSLDIFYSHIRDHFSEIPEEIRDKICFAFLDERVVPEDHPDSNERQLREKFLGQLVEGGLIQESQILGTHIISSDVAGEYSTRVPRIDIGLFGVGPDGHIASLFPHHPLVDSIAKNYLEITDSPKPPAQRITVSPEMIREMSYVFIAFMRGKEEVFYRFQNSDTLISECPVKVLLGCENLIVMSDIE